MNGKSQDVWEMVEKYLYLISSRRLVSPWLRMLFYSSIYYFMLCTVFPSNLTPWHPHHPLLFTVHLWPVLHAQPSAFKFLILQYNYTSRTPTHYLDQTALFSLLANLLSFIIIFRLNFNFNPPIYIIIR